MTGQLWRLSAGELLGAFRDGRASPEAALAACLQRIRDVDPAVAAVTALDEITARRAAREHGGAYATGAALGPLAGVPVLVKELIEVAGLPFTGGSATRSDVIGRSDAEIVARLRAAGAVIVGTTRTHELAWGITTQHERLGSTRNPWNRERVPGGSSGGSAAAVAYGASPLAVGTDTGGSIRVPAAFCGVVGFKPTFGLVPVTGCLPLAPSFDHVGLFAREVPDIALALGLEIAPPPSELRVGVPAVPSMVPLAAPIRAALDAACASLGRPHTIALPDPERTFDIFRVLQARQALAEHRTTLGTWPDRAGDYGSGVRARLEAAEEVTDDEVAEATGGLDEVRRATLRAMTAVDVVLQPCGATGPSTIARPDEVMVGGRAVPLREAILPCTVLHDLVGLPACAIPVGIDGDGVPIGVQVAGRPGDDGLVLAVAAALRDHFRGALPAWPPLTPEDP